MDESGAKRDPAEPSWFCRLFGAEEGSYGETQGLFALSTAPGGADCLTAPNGRTFQAGLFETPSLKDLRSRVARECGTTSGSGAALEFQNVIGDARSMHAQVDSNGAVFQVASQFNCLEFLNSGVVPEDGVTQYEVDHTQGPACALACAASTVWRNYFVPLGDGEEGAAAARGQTTSKQVNTLRDVQKMFGPGFLDVRNGYTFSDDVESLASQVEAMQEEDLDALRAACRVGVQWGAEVTDEVRVSGGETAQAPSSPMLVTQVFCSALALGSSPKLRYWRPFAQVVLDAAYEATLAVAAINLARGGPRDVYITLLGGGAFGNGPKWIEQAVRRALDLYVSSGLRVRLVHLSEHSPWMASYAKLAGERGGARTQWLHAGAWSTKPPSDNGDEDDDDNDS